MTRLQFHCARLSGLLAVLTFGIAASAQTTVTVDATMNLYGAGHTTPPAPGGNGAGILPVMIPIPAGTQRSAQLSNVSGMVDYGPCCAPNPADGILATAAPDWPALAGLAGPSLPTRSHYLAGVLLDDTEPVDPAPAALAFSSIDFSSLSPALRQMFFTGDGMVGSDGGAAQTFNIPDGATRLYLGLLDRQQATQPGWYGDNSGSLSVTVTFSGNFTGDGGTDAATDAGSDAAMDAAAGAGGSDAGTGGTGGTAGTGGTGGTAGTGATGGTGGSSATGGTGGSGATGGSGGVSSDAGTAGSGGSTSRKSGGCGCYMARNADPATGALAALGLLLVVGVRRRRV